MEADTRQYLARNNRQPRGFGRWGFLVGNETFFFVDLYSNARKEAFKVAQAQGEELVVVLPDKKLAPHSGHYERPKLTNEQINSIKERLMAQAETRTINKRTRMVVPVKGLKATEVMVGI